MKDKTLNQSLNQLLRNYRKANQLFRNYRKAEAALIKKRDELFPAGTKVRSSGWDMIHTIKEGSLYADQVVTEIGHINWSYLEIIP